MWWLFSKKTEDKTLKKVNKIEKSLLKSFTHIKGDIDGIFNKLDLQEEKITYILSRIENLESSSINQPTEQIEQYTEQIEQSEQPSSKTIQSLKTTLNDLTDTQLGLLKKLIALQKENKDNWVLMRSLTEEAYPNKDPLKVRSTISGYLSILDDLGLIQKRRKGRQILLKITDRLKEFIPPEIKIKTPAKRKKN